MTFDELCKLDDRLRVLYDYAAQPKTDPDFCAGAFFDAQPGDPGGGVGIKWFLAALIATSDQAQQLKPYFGYMQDVLHNLLPYCRHKIVPEAVITRGHPWHFKPEGPYPAQLQQLLDNVQANKAAGAQ